MNGILEWPPIIWTVRIALLILVGGAAYLFVLLIARFFRWTNIRTMLLADPPSVESVGGEFAGAKAELKLFQNTRSGLDGGRVADLEAKMDRVLAAITSDDGQRRKKR